MSLYHVQSTSTHEYLYKCAMLSEAHWLLGYMVDFYPCLSYKRDVSDDPHPKWGPPVAIHIVFESDSKAAMRRMNWMAEDGENVPYIANFSNIIWPKFKDYIQKKKKDGLKRKQIVESVFNEDGTPVKGNDFFLPVDRYSKIVVPYNMMVRGEQKFIISEVQGDSINPFLWTAKLIPYREQIDLDPSTKKVEMRLSDKPEDAVSGHAMLTNNVETPATEENKPKRGRKKSSASPDGTSSSDTDTKKTTKKKVGNTYASIGGKDRKTYHSPNRLNLSDKPWS